MVERTTFEQVVDGDYLSQGFFNEIRPSISNAGIFNEITSNNRVSHVFSTDEAQTKTNFTYDAEVDQYYAKAGASVLEMPTTGTKFTYGKLKVGSGYVKHNYYVATEYDECDDSSADTALWTNASTGSATGATFSEDAERLRLNYSNAGGSSYGPLNVILQTDSTNGTFTDEIITFKVKTSGGWNGGGENVGINIIGTTSGSVNFKAGASVSSELDNAYIIKFDQANQEAWVWEDGTLMSGSPFDLSTISGNYQLEVFNEYPSTASNGKSWQVDMYFLRKITGSETTTITESFSSNNGTNYSTVSNNYVTIPSAQQSYQMRTKLTSTVATGELVVVDRVDYQGLTADEV